VDQRRLGQVRPEKSQTGETHKAETGGVGPEKAEKSGIRGGGDRWDQRRLGGASKRRPLQVGQEEVGTGGPEEGCTDENRGGRDLRRLRQVGPEEAWTGETREY
jgi:hypothetical protein